MFQAGSPQVVQGFMPVHRLPGPMGWSGLGAAWGGGEQADLVSVAGEHGQGAAAVPADIQLAEPGVLAGDGSLVARLEPGVRVGGVFEGDAVAALVTGVCGLVVHRLLLPGMRAGGVTRSRAIRPASARNASPAAVKYASVAAVI